MTEEKAIKLTLAGQFMARLLTKKTVDEALTITIEAVNKLYEAL